MDLLEILETSGMPKPDPNPKPNPNIELDVRNDIHQKVRMEKLQKPHDTGVRQSYMPITKHIPQGDGLLTKVRVGIRGRVRVMID